MHLLMVETQFFAMSNLGKMETLVHWFTGNVGQLFHFENIDNKEQDFAMSNLGKTETLVHWFTGSLGM